MFSMLKKVFFRLLVGILSWVLLLFISMGFLFGMLFWSAKGKSPKVEPGSLLVINLAEDIIETAQEENTLRKALMGLLGSPASTSLRGAMKAIKDAQQDERIRGIVLKLEGTQLMGGSFGLSEAKELHDRLLSFKKGCGKPIHAFMDGASLKYYYLASVADSISLVPESLILVNGLGGNRLFWGGFFEKYGIGVHATVCGTHKGGAEVYTRTGFSPEVKTQMQGVLDLLWNQVKGDIAASRNCEPEAIQKISDHMGTMSTNEAVEQGLADELLYWDGFLEKIAPLGILDVETQEVRQVSLANYVALNALQDAKSLLTSSKDQLAIVYAQGPIYSQSPSRSERHINGLSLAEQLRKIRKDKKIKAVVLRIDSPGGSAFAAQTLQREVELLNKSKPVVVSMSNYAASAGYMIAAPASAIIASPMTITGSIGAYSLSFDAQKAANDHGLFWDKISTGTYSDPFSIAAPETPEMKERRQQLVKGTYRSFVNLVAQGRNIPIESMDAIANGNVWSSTQALEHRLIDGIGDLDSAIQKAKELAGLGEKPIKIKEFANDSFHLLDFLMTQLRSALVQGVLKGQGALAPLGSPVDSDLLKYYVF